ncbi:hypothetical protein ASC82_00025 [Streptomyces sp. Root431]|uniref:hypothetical protein n=1 Tax=Streptomyces sp. Root431 TaxID=1736535 RepID=UPI0006F5A21B|nr:hypothetical protein [Streptomyces sp. Root431]KQX16699.1 hypothetical protein ASC82_00025 [Streptomyces sp. Root431]
MLQQRHRPAARPAAPDITAPAAAPATTAPVATPGGPVALLLGAAAPHRHPGEAAANSTLLETWSSGVRTWVLDRAELLAARGPEARILSDEATGLDSVHADACVTWARDRRAAGHRFDLVLGLREDVQLAAARLAAALDLPGNHPDAVRRVQDTGARLAALAAGGFLVDEDPDRAPEGTALTAVGAFVSGRPHVFLLAAPTEDGWAPTTGLPHTPQDLAAEAAAAVLHLGLCFGVFRVDLRATDRGIAVSDVRLTLEAPGLQAHLARTLPCVELFNLVYDDALGRTTALPAPPLAPAAQPPTASTVPPFVLLAGEPEGAAAEPHICRGTD